MNIRDMIDKKFFIEQVKSSDQMVQTKAFELMFGTVKKHVGDDGEERKSLEGSGKLFRYMKNVVRMYYSGDEFVDAYESISSRFFMYLREKDDKVYENIQSKDVGSWLWSVLDNYIVDIKPSVDDELADKNAVSFDEKRWMVKNEELMLEVPDNELNRYLSQLSREHNGEYKVRLIESLVFEGMSAKDFLLQENEFRKENGINQLLSGVIAVGRDKERAINSLISITCKDMHRLRKHIYMDLAASGNLVEILESMQRNEDDKFVFDRKIAMLEDCCLGNGDIVPSVLPLLKNMFKLYYTKKSTELDDIRSYFKDYRWLFNKYLDIKDDKNDLPFTLNRRECETLKLYFEKGQIMFAFPNVILKLGQNYVFIVGNVERGEKIRVKHKELLMLKDIPIAIEEKFKNSYNEMIRYKMDREDEKAEENNMNERRRIDEEEKSFAF